MDALSADDKFAKFGKFVNNCSFLLAGITQSTLILARFVHPSVPGEQVGVG